jgi:hypothetical protein
MHFILFIEHFIEKQSEKFSKFIILLKTKRLLMNNKIIHYVLLISFFSITAFAQQDSYVEKYKRVTIPKTGANFLQRLSETGVDLHCGAIIEENSVQLELSESELQEVTTAGFSYNVLIDDLTSYYSERAQRELPTAMRNLELEKQFARFQRAQSFQQPSGTQAATRSIGQIFLNNIAQPDTITQEIDWVTPQNYNLGSMGGMVTIAEMEAQLDQMRALFPNLITAKAPISTTETTWQGRNVWYVKISDNPDTNENEPETLITSNIHAREAAAITNNLFFMWYLLENYATDPFVKNIVDNSEIYFIPMVNPDGVARNQAISASGGGMQRKNLRNVCAGATSETQGVDLNRNFDYWYANPNGGSSTNTCSDSYRGPSAFSEPESRMLRDFVLAHQFETVQMHHSFANSIPHPFGGSPLTLTGRENEFYKFHIDLTQYNRYVFGPTIFPAATGIADDWMLGGGPDNNGKTGSGQAILATTPESGSSAEGSFWPAPNTLTLIAKRALRINFINVLYAMKFAVLHDLTPSNLTTQTVNLQFGIERLGQTPGNFTLTVTPVSSNIVSITSPATQTGMSVLEQRNVTAVMQLNSNIGPDEEIKYRVKLSNEDHDLFEAEYVKVFSPVVAFFDNAEAGNLNNWTGGTWVNTSTTAFNGSRSFTDAVTVAYGNNLNKSISLANPINLQAPTGKTLTKILIQFYAKWDLERNFDFVEFQGSTNGTTWISLNGLYNKPSAKASTNGHDLKSAANEAFQQNGTLVYDGDQMDKWVREEVIIDPNNNNFLVGAPNARFRFLFRTDSTNLTDNFTTSFDGFFFDDFSVLKIVEPPTLTVVDNQLETIKISPNPFKNSIQISWPELSGEGFTATLFDLQGRLIKQQAFDNSSVQTIPIDASLSQGLYLLKLESDSGKTHTEKLVRQ